jgi:hypothetical protein
LPDGAKKKQIKAVKQFLGSGGSMVAKLKLEFSFATILPPNPKSFVVRNLFEIVKEIFVKQFEAVPG